MSRPAKSSASARDRQFMRLALQLAQRGCGHTSPNPMVGAILVKAGAIIGKGWHRQAGRPHAEIEALHDAEKHGHSPRGATLYVTLEPCSTHGRTPPCASAIQSARIRRVVVAATDPNPAHAGRGIRKLRRSGIRVDTGLLADEATELNEAFNHWIIHRTPLVTVKAAMSLDGRIATTTGESRWITGAKARLFAMRLRQRADAILVGVNTVTTDDPALTVRKPARDGSPGGPVPGKRLRRFVLDPHARTPLSARLLADPSNDRTTCVVSKAAPARRVTALSAKASVWVAPARNGRIDIAWLLRKLGRDEITHLLVEGGGEANASFLFPPRAHRIAFLYAPKVLGGATAPKAVGGEGARGPREILKLDDLRWTTLGPDLLLQARIHR
jgi:diaminohydroxyphosphoribosylaminopyrimidine deaminase/5-amino-6-(5-phosphoribosylamino)uracil reductase